MIEVTFNEALGVFIAWFLVLLYNYRQIDNGTSKQGTSLGGFFLIYLLFSVFDFTGGDFKMYSKIYEEMLRFHKPVHVEDIYYQLAVISGGSFYVWRLLVWGTSLIFLCLTVKRLKLSSPLFTMLMLLMCFVIYIGARQSLAFSILFYGLSFIVKPLKSSKFISYLLLIIFCTLSFFCHKSMPLYILVSIMAMFIRLNKTTLLIMALIFPILYGALFSIGGWLIDAFFVDYAKNGLGYLESEDVSDINIFGMLRRTLDWIPIFIFYYYIIKQIIKHGADIIKPYGLYFKIALFLFYVFMLFIGQETSKFLSPRFYDASLLPLVIFGSWFFLRRRKSNLLKFAFIMCAVSQTYRFLYILYKYSG